MTYLDTSLLVKLYIPEIESPEAIRIFTSLHGGGSVSLLSDVEMASALHRAHPQIKAQKALSEYKRDRSSGLFQQIRMDDAVFALASQLAEQYAAQFKLRSLDILHLATALHHGAGSFITYDGRQAEAAKTFGLQVLP